MRHSKLTADEIFEAEKSANDRKVSRASGFAKMKERDRGWAELTPQYGSVKEASIEWGGRLPDDKFRINIRPYGGKEISVALDAEEFRKYLRWV